MSSSAARAVEARTDAAAIVDALMSAFASAGEAPRFASVAAPLVDPERAALAIEDDGIVLIEPNGDASVGLERAYEISVPREMLGLRGAMGEVFERLVAGRRGPIEPFAIGALSFDASRHDNAHFDELGDGAFVVPRVAYVIRRGRAFLVAAGGASDAPRVAALASRLSQRLWDAVPACASHVASIDDADDARFASAVDVANTAIARRELDKVVVARRMTLTLDTPILPASLLRSLAERAPMTYRFLMKRGRSAFVGASPERLVSCRGGHVSTVALAGTMRPGAASELFASAKDRAEHQWVVDAICAALGPLCVGELVVARDPHPRELRDLVHLETTVEGTLGRTHDVFDVIHALHPTPAVGGAPRAAALRHIASTEPFGRGFYAAPFGIVNASGDAEIIVALRSGLFCGQTAYLYAGAGIVAGSVSSVELAETDLKLRALLGALGDAPSS